MLVKGYVIGSSRQMLEHVLGSLLSLEQILCSAQSVPRQQAELIYAVKHLSMS